MPNTFTKELLFNGQAYKVVIKLNNATEKVVNNINANLQRLDSSKYQVEEKGLVSFSQTEFGQALKDSLDSIIKSQAIRMMYFKPIAA